MEADEEEEMISGGIRKWQQRDEREGRQLAGSGDRGRLGTEGASRGGQQGVEDDPQQDLEEDRRGPTARTSTSKMTTTPPCISGL